MPHRFVEELRKWPIDLLPSSRVGHIREILATPAEHHAACDFYVEGAESWELAPWGFEREPLVNIDHHAPVAEMQRHISSGNLAIEFVNRRGPAKEGWHVCVNHTDCDSVVSSAIVRGILPPDERFGRAVVAADHTGEPDEVAQLLQAMSRARDLEGSLENLGRLLDGERLTQSAYAAIQRDRRKEQRAREAVDRGYMQHKKGLWFGIFRQRLFTEDFIRLLPSAILIAVFSPRKYEHGRYQANLRLGTGAPPGLTLHDLGIEEFDPSYGGRWNAGSNGRGGGTSLKPERYVKELEARLQRALSFNS